MFSYWIEIYQNRWLTENSDIFYGSSSNEIIHAYGGNDYINGGRGNDIINAGAGNDSVNGGSGNDIIRGGDGNDFMTGGSGSDIFEFEFETYPIHGSYSGISASADTITDFEAGSDKLDVSALNLDSWHDLFDGGRDYMYQDGSDTVIVANRPGHHSGEVTITLLNTDMDDLSANDFMF